MPNRQPLILSGQPILWKPPRGSVIDWNHPLARGLLSCFLLNEGAGKTVLDIAKRGRTSTLAAGASWVTTPYGVAVKPSSTAAQKNTFSSNPTTSGIPFTVEIMLKHTGSDATFAALLTDLTTWGCYIHANHIDLDGGADPDSTATLTTGNFYHCVWYWDGTNAAYAVNGLRDSGGGANTGITNPAVFTGWGGDGTNPAQNNTILWFRIWNRVLTDGESLLLSRSPFDMIVSPQERAISYAIMGGTLASSGQITAQAGVGIGVAQNATVQTTYSIQAQPGVGIGVAQNALVKTNYQIAPAAGVGIGVAQNALVSTSYQIASATGLGIGVAQNALVSSTYTIAATAGVGIGVIWNATLSGNQNQIAAQPGAGIGVAGALLVQQTYSIVTQANVGFGVAQNAFVQQQYRIAALAGLAIGVMANATLQSGLGANNPPPSATVAASSPVASALSASPGASAAASSPSASVQIGTPAATATSSSPTGKRGTY